MSMLGRYREIEREISRWHQGYCMSTILDFELGLVLEIGVSVPSYIGPWRLASEVSTVRWGR